MNKNKKISLTIAGAMTLSILLPFAKIGPISISLLDAVNAGGSPELIGLIVLIIAFGVLTFMDKHLFARICSGLILVACLYGAFKMADAQSGLNQFNMDVNIFSILGIGAYLLLLGSIAGLIFSKPKSE
tara:strand:- start:218 stop:604 length:387 start_codon:yes stop_codon:yes gene_type:complete